MVFSYTIPVIFISMIITGNVIPQFGLIGDYVKDGAAQTQPLIEKINQISLELGFSEYTANTSNKLDLFCITAALMVGTAGLPHVIVRFFTVKNVRAVRKSAYWTLSFIAIIYLTAPALGMFARTNFIEEINERKYQNAPDWFKNWENQGMIAWIDKNGDGIMQYRAGDVFVGKPVYEDASRQRSPLRQGYHCPCQPRNGRLAQMGHRFGHGWLRCRSPIDCRRFAPRSLHFGLS